MPVPARHRLNRALPFLPAAAYLATVATLEVLRRHSSWPRIGDLASTPAGVAAGHVWTLLTSGFVVEGDPVVQLVGTAITAFAAIWLLGGRTFWLAIVSAHIGSAVIAYVGIGILWVLANRHAVRLVDAPDYGISCVWAGLVGALVGALLWTRGHARGAELMAAGPAALGAFLLIVGHKGELANTEHALAFAIGVCVIVVRGFRAPAAARAPVMTPAVSARPGPAAPYGPVAPRRRSGGHAR
ncbi:MAG: hypothetical protein JWO02_4433 [Solirubrobacterales bacterium]|nr:hypothetical protein [Solirubrobacterales bacterium]